MPPCTHGGGTALVDGACLFCGVKIRRRRPQLVELLEVGRRIERAVKDGGDASHGHAWLNSGGGLRTWARNPPPYKRSRPERPEAPEAPSAAERLRAARARVCKLSLAEFVKRAWHVTDPTVELQWNWHHDSLCLHLQRMFEDWLAVSRGEKRAQLIQNLIINVPPGTSKSRIASVFFPAWCWLHEPAWRVICLSANPKVAERDAPVSRQLIESEWYRDLFQPAWALNPDINARSWYANSVGGERRSFGIDANIVGLRADAILVDDPNDPKEAFSETARDAVKTAWDQAIGNRLNDLKVGIRILIQQRLHDDDLTGHLLRQRTGWEHLRIPLEYESNPSCGCPTCVRGETLFGWRDKRTVDGENLHPLRFPPEVVAFEKARLGAYGSAGQLQQRPAPDGGAILKRQWFKEYLSLPDKPDDVLITADLANKKTTIGSFNVLLCAVRKGSAIYLAEILRNRGEWTATIIAQQIKELQGRWHKQLGRLPKVLVEDKAMGPTVIEMLKQDLGVQGVVQDDEAQQARDDKVSRLMAVQPRIEGGAVTLPKGAPWADEFLHEVCTFPMSANDDQVDCLSMALNYWRLSSGAAKFISTWARG